MKCALISGTYFFIQLGSLNRNKGTKQSIAVQKATSSWGADVRLKQGANMVTTTSSFGQTVGNLTTYIHACMHACIHTYIHTHITGHVLFNWSLMTMTTNPHSHPHLPPPEPEGLTEALKGYVLELNENMWSHCYQKKHIVLL